METNQYSLTGTNLISNIGTKETNLKNYENLFLLSIARKNEKLFFIIPAFTPNVLMTEKSTEPSEKIIK